MVKSEKDEAHEEYLKALKVIKSKLDYDSLKKEYELSPDDITPRSILRKMGERLEEYIKIVIQIMQPEEYHSLHECTMFDENDKVQMHELYKNLMILHREILKSEIDDAHAIATIKEANSQMITIKPQMLHIVQKMQDSWKKKSIKGNVGYFG